MISLALQRSPYKAYIVVDLICLVVVRVMGSYVLREAQIWTARPPNRFLGSFFNLHLYPFLSTLSGPMIPVEMIAVR